MNPGVLPKPSDSRRLTKRRAVTTQRMSSRSNPCITPRGPVVQLIMTGVLPAKSAAKVATLAATEAGSMMPTYDPGMRAKTGRRSKSAVIRSR